MSIAQRMTYADLMEQPEDGCLHELVRGEIVRMPPPKGEHGAFEFWLGEAIGRYLYERARGLGWAEDQGRRQRNRLVGALAGGEFGIRFTLPDDPDQVRGVDVCYLTPEQVRRHEESGSDEYFPGVPALVIEVISPSESAEYVDQKISDYLAGGAQLVWLVYPRTRTVKVYSPDEPLRVVRSNDVLTGEPVLPGFALPLAGMFD